MFPVACVPSLVVCVLTHPEYQGLNHCLDAVLSVFHEIQCCITETGMECSYERLEGGVPNNAPQ